MVQINHGVTELPTSSTQGGGNSAGGLIQMNHAVTGQPSSSTQGGTNSGGGQPTSSTQGCGNTAGRLIQMNHAVTGQPTFCTQGGGNSAGRLIQINHAVTEQPSSSTQGGSNYAGGLSGPSASSLHPPPRQYSSSLGDSTPSDPPPSTPSPKILDKLRQLIAGFEGEDEKRFWRFVQLRHLSSTVIFHTWYSVITCLQLAISLWSGASWLTSLCLILMLALLLVNLMLCKTKRLDQLTVGMACVGIGRTVMYCLPFCGLAPVYNSHYYQQLLIPFEIFSFTHSERVPIRRYIAVHHAIWSTMFLRNDYVSSGTQQHPFLFVAGYFAALAIRV